MRKLFILLIVTIVSFNTLANDNAKRVVGLLIQDEINRFNHGGDSIFSKNILVVSSSQLIKEYESNQSTYENSYDNKIINLKTLVSGVKTSLSGEPYILANGKSGFEYVSLFLNNKDDILTINIGDKIDMICLGTKDNVKHPILINCVTADSYFKRFVELTMNDFNGLKENDKPQTILEAYYLAAWELDNKKPNVLNKYQSISDLSNQYDLIEIVELAVPKTTNETPYYNLPKP